MPERLLMPRAPRVAFYRLSPSPHAITILSAASLMMVILAVRLEDQTSVLAVISIAIGFACVALLAFGLKTVQKGHEKRSSEMFDAIFGLSDTAAFLTSSSGYILAANKAAEPLASLNGSNRISSVLEAHFPHDQGVEYRLRKGLRGSSRSVEILKNNNGIDCVIDVRICGSDELSWSIEPKMTVSDLGHTDPNSFCSDIVSVVVDKDNKIIDSSPPAELMGLLKGADLNECAQSSPIHPTIYTFAQAGDQNFRRHSFERNDGLCEYIFLPDDTEELASATSDQFLEALPVALGRVAPDGEILHLNGSAKTLLGRDGISGGNLNSILEGLGRPMDERIRDMILGRDHMRTEVARAKVNGQEVFLQVTLSRIKFNGEMSILAVMNDATELKTLEAQFVQSQKMQAVGQLAGGVAHDFNNLRTAINGHCDLILMRHETTDTDYGDLIQIRHNANRAASLVGQLLAFSRKQTLLPKVIDLYDTLSDLNHLLNRLLGEKVTLVIDHEEGLPSVRVDERQLEQVIMNLVVNARDAMPNGGEVVIETSRVEFEKDRQMDRVVIPFGAYVQIDVSDTGTGIPEDKISKIFEPFFTTKRIGEGTGLGLSTAYGIIKQTGGFIFAKSEVGSGTTFTIYLPTHALDADAGVVSDSEVQEPTDLTGRGVVLLVEDEVPVRSFAARALNIRGYTVVEAASAEEALEILEDTELHVDVFVSDVIMPGMDGPTWVRMALEKRPDTRVVFVSGYAEDAFEGGQISVPNATFLPKPFSLNELTHTVKEQMERSI